MFTSFVCFLLDMDLLAKNFNEVRFSVDSYKVNVFNYIFVEMHVFQPYVLQKVVRDYLFFCKCFVQISNTVKLNLHLRFCYLYYVYFKAYWQKYVVMWRQHRLLLIIFFLFYKMVLWIIFRVILNTNVFSNVLGCYRVFYTCDAQMWRKVIKSLFCALLLKVKCP